MAVTAFRITGQRDYARLDCRVRPDGRCFFLEINTNPQLALGKASFAVSAAAAGMELGEVFRSIVDDEMPPWGPMPLAARL